MNQNPPKLELRGVHKAFGDKAVLNGIDLVVDDHEVVCLIGPSGCGKSTLLRCVDLLDPIDAGSIHLDGVDITRKGVDANQVRRSIGIVFQSYNLFPHMTVLDNVTLGPRRALGMKKADAEVAHTIGYRRRKGTAAVLEQLARDVTGWPAARVVEMHVMGMPGAARETFRYGDTEWVAVWWRSPR